jgi:hypothetical protein
LANGIWVFDCEGDGLNPTKLYCLAACSPQGKNVFVTNDYDKMRKFLLSAKVLIGHNIRRWDIPHIERILGIKITAKLVDTLSLSWYLYPERFNHGLDGWGEDLGVKKPVITDWLNQTQEEYEHRCSEDVKINVMLWNKMYRYLFDIYGSSDGVWKLLKYLDFKLYCAMLQERSQWKLDIENAEQALAELTELQSQKIDTLARKMPPVPVVTFKHKPKRFLNKDGSYSKMGMDWMALLSERKLPPSHEEPIEITKGYEQGNPNSTSQIKDWLTTLGWVPRTFKEVKNKTTGEVKSNSQINLEHGKGICGSIKALYPKEPSLELLDGLSVLQHRIGILKGFLRDQENGWIKAQVAGLTNTLRFKHTTIVNLPKPGKLYADGIRASLVAGEGMILCGADMSSLEDRIKQHFIYPYDPDFVKEMMEEGYDPHLSLALSASAVTIEQVLKYKDGTDKGISPTRDVFKNGNYA